MALSKKELWTAMNTPREKECEQCKHYNEEYSDGQPPTVPGLTLATCWRFKMWTSQVRFCLDAGRRRWEWNGTK